MNSTSERRFDPNRAARLLLEIAHEQSLEVVLNKIVERAVADTEYVAAQFWLIKKGDRCATCKFRAQCPDQTRCFHLVAAKGRSIVDSKKSPGAYEDFDARVPLGFGPLGQAVGSGQQELVINSNQEAAPAPGFEWLAEERIRAYGISPIRFKGEALGALVGFTREDIPEASHAWVPIFADHVGAAVANARAFEEIHALKTQLEHHNRYLQEAVIEARAFGTLVGQSAALRHIVGQIDVVAPTEASVLILGETGTGKELVAHEIHCRSGRKDGAFVRVNCASIPRDLFESEFFGHIKGAFTGALKDRAGRFETADGGTLFLDEVGEIPLDIQNKLLRVLQEKKYERVGDDRTRRANVRIVAATNRDLKKEVAEGRFREDLYYRLNVFPIEVPPLRERMEDIPALAKHFVEIAVREMKCAKPRLTGAAVTRLQNYDWPGNVRELRNLVERAVILARGGPLAFDVPVSASLPASARKAPQPELVEETPATKKFFTEAELQRRERDNLLQVLEAAHWKIKGPDGAAELLGVKPTTLLSRMEKWGLQRPGQAG